MPFERGCYFLWNVKLNTEYFMKAASASLEKVTGLVFVSLIGMCYILILLLHLI